MNRLPILTTLLILTACAAPVTAAPTAAPSHTPPPTSTSTATPTATATPTPTISPTTTDILPTPDFLTLPIGEDFLFAPSIDPDCQLPCWQGLRVGESDRDDIQEMFDTVFGFNHTVDFFDESYLDTGEEIPGLYSTGYWWRFSTEYGSFHLTLWLDENTHLLQGTLLVWAPYVLEIYAMPHTPQQMLKALGQPSYLLVSDSRKIIVRDSEIIDDVSGHLLMIYEDGLAIEYPAARVPIKLDENGEAFGEYCLNSIGFTPEEVHLLEPFTDGLSNLTPLQEHYVGHAIDRFDLIPFDQVYDTDLETLIESVMQEENTCIRTR